MSSVTSGIFSCQRAAFSLSFSVFGFRFSVGRASVPADLKCRVGTAHQFPGGTGFPAGAQHRPEAWAISLIGAGLSTDLLPIFEVLFEEHFPKAEIFHPYIPQLAHELRPRGSNKWSRYMDNIPLSIGIALSFLQEIQINGNKS